MNEIVNKFLLAWDRCIPEIDLKRSAALEKSPFTYRPSGPFTKNWIEKFKETEDSRYIYQNELDKACF